VRPNYTASASPPPQYTSAAPIIEAPPPAQTLVGN